MNVKELKEQLKKINDDKIVIIIDSRGGWTNIEKIKENSVYLMIEQEEDGLFHDS